jgi:hypothetical protein
MGWVVPFFNVRQDRADNHINYLYWPPLEKNYSFNINLAGQIFKKNWRTVTKFFALRCTTPTQRQPGLAPCSAVVTAPAPIAAPNFLSTRSGKPSRSV